MNKTPATRSSLLVRLKDTRDQQAWCEFMEIYEPVAYRLARRQGLQDADAQEVAQDVMVAVARAIANWDSNREKGTFRGWLARVTRNVTINLVTRLARRPNAAGGTEMLFQLQQEPDRRQDSCSQFYTLEHKRQIFRWAAAQIRDQFRDTTWQAFWQTCVEHRAVAVVSEELNISVGAIYVARSRVMARLRESIESLSQD